jgi:hypothetical protein
MVMLQKFYFCPQYASSSAKFDFILLMFLIPKKLIQNWKDISVLFMVFHISSLLTFAFKSLFYDLLHTQFTILIFTPRIGLLLFFKRLIC